PVEVGALLQEVGHFLRNEAATRRVTVTFDVPTPIHILAEPGKLKTLLVGLATAAIDCTPATSGFSIRAAPVDGWAVIRIDSELGLVDSAELLALRERPLPLLNAKDLTLSFAIRYLKARGARLDFVQAESNPGLLQISYPIMAAG
ncbi:MAG: hypothetical protein M3O06_04420, partial [Pseudomonadota bacterium]|nr:hypothetical protein [Pseudomonadota bacterium]